MTVIQLFTSWSSFGMGYITGKECGSHYGLIGWILVFVFGCLLAILITSVFRRLLCSKEPRSKLRGIELGVTA